MAADLIFPDDNAELREVMVDIIGFQLGLRCLPLQNFSELLENQKAALSCGLAILDIELGYQEPSGLAVFEWLKNQGFNGKVFFLTGHGRNHPLVQKARQSGAQVWEKPMGSQDMIKALQEAMRLPYPELEFA